MAENVAEMVADLLSGWAVASLIRKFKLSLPSLNFLLAKLLVLVHADSLPRDDDQWKR